MIGRDTTTENYPERVTSYDNLYGEAGLKGVPHDEIHTTLKIHHREEVSISGVL